MAGTGRALVTGASGFIGRHLVRRLLEDGVEVAGLARTAEPAAGIVAGDLADPDTAARVLREARPDVVYHLASHVSGVRGIEAVLPTLDANLRAAVHLLV